MNIRNYLLAALSLGLLTSSLTFTMEELPPAPKTGKEEEKKEISLLERLEQYFDYESAGISMVPVCRKKDTPFEDKIKKCLEIAMDQVKFSAFTITLEKDGQKTEHKATEFIDSEKLVSLLKKIVSEYFDKEEKAKALEQAKEDAELKKKRDAILARLSGAERETREAQFTQLEKAEKEKRDAENLEKLKKVKLKYVKKLEKVIKKDAFKKALGEQGALDIEKVFEKLKQFIKKGNMKDVQEAINFEKICAVLGIDINKYVYVDQITNLVNSLLEKKSIDKALLLGCLKFKAIFGLLKYKGKDGKEVAFDLSDEQLILECEEAIKGALSFFVDLARDTKKAGREMIRLIAGYGFEERHPELQQVDNSNLKKTPSGDDETEIE